MRHRVPSHFNWTLLITRSLYRLLLFYEGLWPAKLNDNVHAEINVSCEKKSEKLKTENWQCCKFQYVFLLLFYSVTVFKRSVESNPDIAPPCTAPTALTAHKSLWSEILYYAAFPFPAINGVTSGFDCTQHRSHCLSLTRNPIFTFRLWFQGTYLVNAVHWPSSGVSGFQWLLSPPLP
jgi:hypothetical protein